MEPRNRLDVPRRRPQGPLAVKIKDEKPRWFPPRERTEVRSVATRSLADLGSWDERRKARS